MDILLNKIFRDMGNGRDIILTHTTTQVELVELMSLFNLNNYINASLLNVQVMFFFFTVSKRSCL